MNKKWSYVAAMMLTASCGCLFTGCIDNDEPYGIEQIRVATANLLEAKKAAVEAEASANNAAAEVAKIQAEIEKAKLEVAKIKAQAEAEAARLQAEAAAAKTQAEAAKLQAEADRIIKETEMAAKQKQAEIDRYIAQTDDMINNANLAYEQLVYQWEQTKIQDAAAATTALFRAVDAAYQSYMSQLSTYNNLNKEYLKAQRKLAAFELDLVWNGESFESPRYDQKEILESEVARLEKIINNNQETIARYNNVKQEIEDATNGSDLEELLAKYTEQQKEVLAELEKANVEKQAIYLDNKALYDSRITLDKQIAEAGNARIAIKPYTFVPSAALKALGWDDDEIVGDDVSFSLNSLGNYDNVKSRLEWKLSSLKNMYLDENDVLWNQAKVNEMERELASDNAAFEELKGAWETAKKVYNMGNTPDLTAVPYEQELEAAITAYNQAGEAWFASLAPYEAAWNAYIDANNKYWELYDDFWFGTGTQASIDWENARQAYNEANNAAWNTYNEATKAAYNKYKAVKDAQDRAVSNANNAYWRAYDEENAIANQLSLDPENKDLKTAYENAQKATEKAWKAYEDAQKAKVAAMDKANIELGKSYAAAETARIKALNVAAVAREKAYEAYVTSPGYAEAKKDPKYAAVEAAEKAMNDALKAAQDASEARNTLRTAMSDAWNKYDDVFRKQNEAVGFYQSNRNNFAQIDNGKFVPATIPMLYQDIYKVYTNAKDYLINKSYDAYGDLGFKNYNGPNHDYLNNIELDKAFLLDQVTPEFVNKLIRSRYGENLSDYDCRYFYGRYGAYGITLRLGANINIAKACIAEPNMGAEASKGVQAELDALEKSLADAKAAEQALVDQKDDVDKQIDALNADIDDKIRDLNHVNDDLLKVIDVIGEGIARLQEAAVGEDDYKHWKADAFKKEIKKAQKAIENAEGQLDKAKYQLGQYEAGYKDLENPFKFYVDYLAAEVESQKEYVSLLKSHLEDVQAIYEKATKE